MFGAILKATNSSFQKGMTFCRNIYVKKVMKLLAFIFEQPSYKNIYKGTRSVTMNIFRKKILFKTFVKIKLSYVFTINMFSTAENCMEK